VRSAGVIAERTKQPPQPLAAPKPMPAAGGRLRIGYVYCDLRDRATAHLTAGLFERHDRGRFEVFGYSLVRDDGSTYRKRIAAGFDHFADAQDEPIHETATRIARDGIHVLVDLMGYTGHARPEIFALRPAPVQVCYLGSPTTTGAEFIDYFVGDCITIPDEDRAWFTESVVRITGSYQVNDDRQPIADGPPQRASGGYARLPRGAASTGGRLVFARHAWMPAYLACHRLADLFLDTQHVNATRPRAMPSGRGCRCSP
jgi:predicted O-linked N-acetylglucosamine transferase (SPINDLY family)